MTIGQNPYTKFLKSLEDNTFELNFRTKKDVSIPYHCNDKTFRICMRIFISAMVWKMHKKMKGCDNFKKSIKIKNFFNELRELIVKYTGMKYDALY